MGTKRYLVIHMSERFNRHLYKNMDNLDNVAYTRKTYWMELAIYRQNLQESVTTTYSIEGRPNFVSPFPGY